MLDRHCKIMQCRSYIRFRHETRCSLPSSFSRTFLPFPLLWVLLLICRCAGLQIQLSGELPCFMRSVRWTVICQPLDWPFRSFIENVFYRSNMTSWPALHNLPCLLSLGLATVPWRITRSFSPSSQPNSKPSEHQRWSLSFTDIRPLCSRCDRDGFVV